MPVMLNQVMKTVATHSMLGWGDHVVVAVSGGPDSVALLSVLVNLRDDFQLNLTAAHLNHGLRKEADREEEFVYRLSAGMGVPCVSRKVDIRALREGTGRSLEEIGRDERYRFLYETADQYGSAKIAVGHHRDDQAETLLLHLLRGSGTSGLKGIEPVRDARIIRPLLEVGRSEILEFLRREGIAFVEDSSNRNRIFLRNRIRHELIPHLAAEYNPRLVAGLCRTADILRREDDYLNGVVRQIIDRWSIVPGHVEADVPLPDFLSLHVAIQARIVKCILEAAVRPGKSICSRHVEAVLGMARFDEERRVSLDLPSGIRVEKDRDSFRIGKAIDRGPCKGVRNRRETLGYEYQVSIPATVYLREIGKAIRLEWVEKPTLDEMRSVPQTAFMDYDSVTPPLILRNMRPGDRVQLLGMKGVKKLKDYFIDRKIAPGRRREIPLLADAGSIVWIAGERISERVRIKERTRRFLRAEIVDSSKPSEMI